MKVRFHSTIIAVITLILCSLTANAGEHTGQKSVGLRGGFTTRNTTATAGLYFSYRVSEHFRLAPKMDYVFRHHGTDAFSFNFDAEMPISLSPANDKVLFYPIAGINYTTMSSHTSSNDPLLPSDVSDDSSQRVNRFGLNLGAGIEYFATPTLRLALEGKCSLIKQYTGGYFTISIGYVF